MKGSNDSVPFFLSAHVLALLELHRKVGFLAKL
jgi:hypothetical protein